MVPWWWILVSAFASGIVGFFLGAICRLSSQESEREERRWAQMRLGQHVGGASDSFPVSGSSRSASGREN